MRETCCVFQCTGVAGRSPGQEPLGQVSGCVWVEGCGDLGLV